MKHKNYVLGFSLIELIAVIAVLGIISVVVIGKHIDITPDARQSAVDGVAGGLNAASAVNYGKRRAHSAVGSAVSNCTDIGALLTGGLPAGYTITSLAIPANGEVTCTVNNGEGESATFTGLGIS